MPRTPHILSEEEIQYGLSMWDVWSTSDRYQFALELIDTVRALRGQGGDAGTESQEL